MQPTEGFGAIGWGAVSVVLLAILSVMYFGFSAAIYFGLLGTAVVLGVIVLLCLGDAFGSRAES